MSIFTRLKKWFIKLFVLVRKKLRSVEGRLDEMQPHPVLGGAIIVAGVFVLIAGIIMLVVPGPGMLGIALGIVAMIVGMKVLRGQYGPDRVERERKEKHRRLKKRRKAQQRRSQA